MLATPVRGALSDLAAEDQDVPTSGMIVPGEPSAETAGAEVRLSPAERDSAISAATDYPRLPEFVGDDAPRVVATAPWTTEDGSGKVIGAEVDLALPGPRKISTTWPSIAFVSETRYVRRDARFRATGVRTLTLLVDLTRGEVVSVEPDAGARVTLPPGARAARRVPSNED